MAHLPGPLPSSPPVHIQERIKQWSIAFLLCLCQGLSKLCYTMTHSTAQDREHSHPHETQQSHWTLNPEMANSCPANPRPQTMSCTPTRPTNWNASKVQGELMHDQPGWSVHSPSNGSPRKDGSALARPKPSLPPCHLCTPRDMSLASPGLYTHTGHLSTLADRLAS